ncbi:MAG: ATP-binding protein, partial [Blastocatellia bacterium]
MKNHSTPSEKTDAEFLLGGGDMGEQIRAMDWSKTPLGLARQWPQSLRTAISILLDSGYPMYIAWGRDFTQIYNDAYRPILGATKHPAALGQSTPECFAEIWDFIGPMFERVMAIGEATTLIDQLLELDRNGYVEECYFTFSYSAIRDETGRPGGVLVTVIETTARVISERRMQTLRELAEQSAQIKSADEICEVTAEILEKNSQDLPFALLYLLDEDGKQARLAATTRIASGTAASPTIITLTDSQGVWPLGEVMRRGSTEIRDLEEKFGPLAGETVKRAIALPLAKAGHEALAGFLVAGISPRLDFNDDYRGFVGLMAGHIATAIANARAYEEERKRAESLAELDRAKTAFFSNVSHEFRTPLTLMLGPAEDLLNSSELSPAHHAQVEVLHRNGLRLLKLVNTLLDFSRIEAGRAQAVYEPLDLAAYTAELASMFGTAIERAGLRLVIDCPSLPEPVFVDRDMWEKVVLNLISNAFKFTEEGEIRVSLRAENGCAVLSIRDTGIGIPEPELPNLFNRFHRVEGARGRTYEGTGIGLALVQELAKLHGGTVTARSVYGKGSDFAVRIPLGKSHLPADRIGVASTALGVSPFVEEALRWLPDADKPFSVPAVPAQSADRAKVILADDNADMRDYVRRLLSSEYDVIAVADGQEALRATVEHNADLVLTDMMMPNLDGFGLLKAIREDPKTASIPVIMLSARAGEDARVEGLQSGADDYLIKPFSARELLARVKGALALARLRFEVARREDDLRRSDEQFQLLFKNSGDAILVADDDGNYIEANQAACEMLGYGHEQLLRMNVSDLKAVESPDATDRYQDYVRKGFETGEFNFVRPDGERRIAQYNASRFAPGRHLSILRDITERKQIEAALKKQSERLRLMWEAASLLLTTDEPDKMVLGLFHKIAPHFGLDTYFNFMVNDAGDALRLESCTGISEETARTITRLEFGQAVCGTVALRCEPIVATYIQDSFEPMTQLIKSFGIRAYACSPLLINGKLLGTLSFASRTRDQFEEDELEFLRTICHYVTVAYERLRLVLELKENDRRKDEFLATLAHELRNPLAPIRNGLQIMRIASDNPTAVEQARETMERQLQQMVHLIDDLLDLSRISRGKVELRKERGNLATVLHNAIETSRPLIEQSGHQLTVSIPPESIFVDADVTRLAQVFANLLNNAAKYTEKGGRIWLTVERETDRVVVSVKDTGVGIPAHQLPGVFEMFSQVDRSLEKSQGGLGIGLSIVRRLVEMHGGTVEARSEGHGLGSEFIVRLPALMYSDHESQPSAGHEQPVSASGQRRILVADDNEDSAFTMATMLRIMGHEVRTAHDGIEAIEAAEAFRPELILLDIGMPRLNGYDACRRIREQVWGGSMVMVALTGWGQDEDKRRSHEAGFDHHLVKPIEPETLEKLLAAMQTA